MKPVPPSEVNVDILESILTKGIVDFLCYRLSINYEQNRRKAYLSPEITAINLRLKETVFAIAKLREERGPCGCRVPHRKRRYFEESATQTYLAIIRILVPPLQTIFFSSSIRFISFASCTSFSGSCSTSACSQKLFPKFFDFASHWASLHSGKSESF
jgi:hypothetical protein